MRRGRGAPLGGRACPAGAGGLVAVDLVRAVGTLYYLVVVVSYRRRSRPGHKRLSVRCPCFLPCLAAVRPVAVLLVRPGAQHGSVPMVSAAAAQGFRRCACPSRSSGRVTCSGSGAITTSRPGCLVSYARQSTIRQSTVRQQMSYTGTPGKMHVTLCGHKEPGARPGRGCCARGSGLPGRRRSLPAVLNTELCSQLLHPALGQACAVGDVGDGFAP